MMSLWILCADCLPKIGQTVITHHFLGRIDMLTFDGSDFLFPTTCPVDDNGKPIGFTASYPLRAITHWMDIPEKPLNFPLATAA